MPLTESLLLSTISYISVLQVTIELIRDSLDLFECDGVVTPVVKPGCAGPRSSHVRVVEAQTLEASLSSSSYNGIDPETVPFAS